LLLSSKGVETSRRCEVVDGGRVALGMPGVWELPSVLTHSWEASASSPFAHKGLRLLLHMGPRPHRQEMELLKGETCPLSSAAPELSLSWDMPQAALCAYYLLNAHGSLPTWCFTVNLQLPSVRALRMPHEMQSL